MAEELFTYGIVVVATVYSGWRLMPAVLRAGLMEWWAIFVPGRADRETVRRQTGASGRGACGSCAGCANNPASNRVAVVTVRKAKE
ncbi:MAG TPA: hypothetical protein PLS67_13605 [Accumulibacter sp.]|jgi:hypothetical protein|nr:hypothetical protein [Accumulibacter sp.]HQC81526.1 hypothetical protein [Accumulibacter sp.]